MADAPRARKPAPPHDPAIARLASSLGVTEQRMAAALRAAGATPQELLASVRAGTPDERVQTVARALRVGRDRVAVALVEAFPVAAWGERAAAAAEGLVTAARGTAEEALGIGLEIVAESLPRLVNNVLAVLAAAGVALVALGALALIDTPTFVRLLAVVAGLALVAAGALLFLLAWRLHEATATLRTLARIAKRWRARRAAEGEAPAAAP